MPISKTTRDRRVSRWDEIKDIWGAKLDAADTDNDKAVAKAMLAEAAGAIKRLETTDEVVPEEAMYSKPKIDTVTKKIKADRNKKDLSVSKDKEDKMGTLGL